MTDDLLKRAEPFLDQCGSCDLGLPYPCNCPTGDFRPVMSELAIEVRRLRVQLTTASRRVSHIAEHGDPATANALALIAVELSEAVAR